MFQARGTICHLCGHPGATVADHVIPKRERPDLVADPSNMRPAHGTDRQVGPGGRLFDARCKVCIQQGKKGTCNGTRGATPLEAATGPYVPPILLDGSDQGRWKPGDAYVPPIAL